MKKISMVGKKQKIEYLEASDRSKIAEVFESEIEWKASVWWELVSQREFVLTANESELNVLAKIANKLLDAKEAKNNLN